MSYTCKPEAQVENKMFVLRVYDQDKKEVHASVMSIENATEQMMKEKAELACLEYVKMLEQKQEDRTQLKQFADSILAKFPNPIEVSDQRIEELKQGNLRVEDPSSASSVSSTKINL